MCILKFLYDTWSFNIVYDVLEKFIMCTYSNAQDSVRSFLCSFFFFLFLKVCSLRELNLFIGEGMKCSKLANFCQAFSFSSLSLNKVWAGVHEINHIPSLVNTDILVLFSLPFDCLSLKPIYKFLVFNFRLLYISTGIQSP